MARLQIYQPRERLLVAAADVAIAPLAWVRRAPAAGRQVDRVLLLRLERIGDLLMTIGAVAEARERWPGASIDLAVGSWNAPLARLIPGVHEVLTLDAPWLSRSGRADGWPALVAGARAWRRRQYDVVVNFEPDIRSNFLAWLSGAPQRLGFWTGGGGAFLTQALAFEPALHVADNAARLLGRTAAGAAGAPRLAIPDDAQARARGRLASLPRPIVGIHASGGRESKQWHLDRFADVARAMAANPGASIVLTGSAEDAGKVAHVAARLQDAPAVGFLDAHGSGDLVDLAALLAALDVFVTADTGPMHLAAAVGTPVVALFGPSDPRRYGPLSDTRRIVRVDLPCSPCGQVRLPPERCRGHVPDCMDAITAASVVDAARDLLATAARQRGAIA